MDTSDFRLLRPEEVVSHWPLLARLLAPAVAQAHGEMTVDDLRQLVLQGRLCIFSDLETLAITAEFQVYPQKTYLMLGFGGGRAEDYDGLLQVLKDYAAKAGASAIRTCCQNPAMARYHRRHFNATPAYTVLETPL